MKTYYWSLESWGDAYPPENADDIIEKANAAIDRYIDENPDADDDMISAYSEKLWESYCSGSSPKTVYEASSEWRCEIRQLALSFDLDEAKDAVLNELHYLTVNERARSTRCIRVIRGFGDTPEEVIDSHLIGLGCIDYADQIDFDDETEQFSR